MASTPVYLQDRNLFSSFSVLSILIKRSGLINADAAANRDIVFMNLADLNDPLT